MKVKKKVIGNLEKCYSIAPLSYQGKDYMLVAAEKVNQCRLYGLDGKLADVIWEGPGGTMSMVQIPNTDGIFLATQRFYSPNDSKDAKIVMVSPGESGWSVRTAAILPFVHRFDIITRDGISYVIACTLKSGHEYKEDWRSPGKVYVCRLPENMDAIDENHSLKFTVLKEGMFKNHGYCKAVMEGIECAFTASNEGVFQFIPPAAGEDAWKIRQLTDQPSSDMAFADMDGDGEPEMLTISPFHGDTVRILKKQNGQYRTVYTYEKPAEFAHGIWGGDILGKQGVLVGHRKGERNLMFFTCGEEGYEAEIIDRNVGPANVLSYQTEEKSYILSANREIDEIALYEVEEVETTVI